MVIKVNMLASVYEVKEKLMVFFEALEKQDLLLSIKIKTVSSEIGKPCGY